MSTIADSLYGLVSTSCSLLFSAVKPSARYHVDDGCVVHGATDVPAGCVARCSTRPPPPSISTIALANGVVSAARGVDDRPLVRRHGDRLLDGLRRARRTA